MAMIISKTPLRVSFLGGGSDLPSHFQEHGGCVVSAAINKYVYVIVRERADDRISYINQSPTPLLRVADIQDKLIRNAIRSVRINSGFDIAIFSDVTSEGSGMGASSAIVVGVIKALTELVGESLTNKEIFDKASDVEINQVGRTIGIQDFLPAIYGGFATYNISKNGEFSRSELNTELAAVKLLIQSLFLVDSEIPRDASKAILDRAIEIPANTIEKNTVEMARLAEEFAQRLCSNEFEEAIEIFNIAWQLKVGTGVLNKNAHLTNIFNSAMSKGASAGKLLGAGSGGTFLFIAPANLQSEISKALRIEVVPCGSEISASSLKAFP